MNGNWDRGYKRVRFFDLAVLEKYTGLWKYFQTLLMMEGFLHHLQNNIENPKMPMKYGTLFIVRIVSTGGMGTGFSLQRAWTGA